VSLEDRRQILKPSFEHKWPWRLQASKLNLQVASKLSLGGLRPPASFKGQGKILKPSFERSWRLRALKLGHGGLRPPASFEGRGQIRQASSWSGYGGLPLI